MKIYFSGGLNEQQQPTLNEAAQGSYNFDLSRDRNALIPRHPFDLKATATNAGAINGIMQLIKRDDSETTLIQAGTAIYSWNGATTFNTVGTAAGTSKLRGTYWSLDDYLIVTDLAKATVVSKWNATTFSTQTTGLGTDLYAAYAIVHLNRVWLFNVKTTTDTPHLMVASAFEDPTSFDITKRATQDTFVTGLEAFYILAPDLRAINGVAKTLAGDLVISTVGGSLFKLSGSDPDTFAFTEFYPLSNAVGTESMASMGNDIVYMRQHGGIDVLSATQNYGDISADDLSRWITTTVAGLSASITVYDQFRQKVLFFVQDKVLVLFKDVLYGGALNGDTGERAKLSPWTVYKTFDSDGFNTSAAAYIRVPGTSSYSVYFGGSDGRIFDINGTGTSGDGGLHDIAVVRKTRFISDADGINFMKGVNKGRLRYRRIYSVPFQVTMDWADEFNESTAEVLLKTGIDEGVSFYGDASAYGGLYYYGDALAKGLKVSHINFSFVGRGQGVTATFTATHKKTYQVEMVEFF